MGRLGSRWRSLQIGYLGVLFTQPILLPLPSGLGRSSERKVLFLRQTSAVQLWEERQAIKVLPQRLPPSTRKTPLRAQPICILLYARLRPTMLSLGSTHLPSATPIGFRYTYLSVTIIRTQVPTEKRCFFIPLHLSVTIFMKFVEVFTLRQNRKVASYERGILSKSLIVRA